MMTSGCNILMYKNKHYTCTFELTMDLIGGKWKCLILWHLGTRGTLRFNEIRKLLPNTTQKMLTQQLRELESDHLIHRKVYAEVPPKVTYSLTDRGETLMPILERMCTWGNYYYTSLSTIEKQ